MISNTYALVFTKPDSNTVPGRKVEPGSNGGGKIIIDSHVEDSEKKQANSVTSHSTTSFDDEGGDGDGCENGGDDGDDSEVGDGDYCGDYGDDREASHPFGSSSTDTHRQINYNKLNKSFHRKNPKP